MRNQSTTKAGVVAPSAPISCEGDRQTREARLEKANAFLAAEGVELLFSPNLRACTGFTAGSAEVRAADLHEMYLDPSVHLIFAARGGRNCSDLLKFLNPEVIKAGNKPLVGYSDISILLNAIHKITGRVQIHGPMCAAGLETDDLQTQKSLLDVVNGRDQRLSIAEFGSFWKAGTCMGTLLGGNIISVENLLGTKHEPDWNGAIFFWEEEADLISRFARVLTHFENCGVWNKINGMIVGHLEGITGETTEERQAAENLRETLLERFKYYDFPILKTDLFGHEVRTQLSIPVGGKCTITANEIELSGGKLLA